jgi:hypothetical protein
MSIHLYGEDYPVYGDGYPVASFPIFDCSMPPCDQPIFVCCQNPCNRWLFSADALYWRALQNGLSCNCGCGIKNHDWNPAYRIGTENDFASSCWDASIYWTHYDARTNQGHKPNDNSSSKHSFGKWKLNFDTVDATIGRDFTLYSCATVRPFVGLRGAWIDESICAQLESSQISNLQEIFITTQQHNRVDFWGVGPQVGVELDWTLCNGFGFYGSIGAGILYGDFNVKFKVTETFSNPTEVFDCKEHHHNQACQAVADAAIGISWQHCFCNNVKLRLRLGWEHHQYFDHSRFGSYGDLYLDGVTFSTGISF